MDMVVGLFHHYAKAKWAIKVLECYYDVDGEHISVVALDKDAIKPRLAADAGAVTGTPATDLAFVLNRPNAFAFELSGVGPVFTTGSLAVELFASLDTHIAAEAGRLLGAMVDSGLSMEEAIFYVEGVKQGSILVFVETALQDQLRIKAILHGAGAVYMNKNPQQLWQSKGGQSTADEIRGASKRLINVR